MQVRVFDQPETDTTVAMTNQEMGQRREAGPMLRDAAVAANAAWLIVAVFYLMAEGASGSGSLFTFLLAGIGFPLLNLLTVLRSESAEWWED
ncbi:hypothetical protein [Rhodospirillaceae bacterium SYSU D60014]|uniref:hypothetical protein n=1 Tax=Virgifigura deserti TaxID=2268457 RepID=UPI0013C4E862